MNKNILQIIADVFEIDVNPSKVTNTAASGAAIRALNSFYKLKHETLTFGLPAKSDNLIRPIPENVQIYRNLQERYSKLELVAMEILNRK